MTVKVLTTIRQQLRKRWGRCVACLVLLLTGYVASTGQILGWAFHPQIDSLPFGTTLQNCVLTFYTPVFVLAGSKHCPDVVPLFMSSCMGDQRERVALVIAVMAEKWAYSSGDDEEAPYGELAFQARLAILVHTFVGRLGVQFGAPPVAAPRSGEVDESQPNFDTQSAAADLNDATLIEPQLPLEVCPSSRLGGSLALPEDLPLKCFEDRPDLILTASDSDQSVEERAQQPFHLSFIDIRDEQELSITLPSTLDQAAVYTLRVDCPELLLDESHVVQLRCFANAPDADEKDRTFPGLRNRIVCQKEFPHRDHQSELLNIIMGFNR